MQNSLVEKIHLSDWCGVFHITGGGSSFLSALLAVPGASSTVLDARVPYAKAALEELIHPYSGPACSPEVARFLAMQGFVKANELKPGGSVFGLGVTASLSTNREKKGKPRAFVALQTAMKTQVSELYFPKGTERPEQEWTLSHFALQKLATGLSIEHSLTTTSTDKVANASNALSLLLHDAPHYVGSPQAVFLPGAFNPLHSGHRRMKELAERTCGLKVQYELSVRNIDKPPLDFLEIERFRAQFSEDELVVTNVPRFREKAVLLAPTGNATFVVGIDTLMRIANPGYYKDQADLESTMSLFRRRNDRFLVFGRTMSERGFTTLDDMEIPAELRYLCQGFSEQQFRVDISSTEVRQHSQQN